ncbi:hypothetical protein L2U69_11895 [Zavarzinia compransoris]|uniref:hypothetical protein n=1 Tax=Zavarzinia marina TaxID=2911065 RepID=UPI001F3CB92D|nr:hypothetical protein [Zavarzinia marina]MCF4166349.1 hypothetical protein [Zavarzinia marina]
MRRRRKRAVMAAQPMAHVTAPDLRPSEVRQAPEAKAGLMVRVYRDTCEVDRLYNDGHLGRPDSDEAKRRLDAALWLRAVHHRSGAAPRVIGSYGALGGDDEMSEQQADAWRLYSEAMRAMGGFAATVQRVCVWDGRTRLMVYLRSGLDRLVAWRGM